MKRIDQARQPLLEKSSDIGAPAAKAEDFDAPASAPTPTPTARQRQSTALSSLLPRAGGTVQSRPTALNSAFVPGSSILEQQLGHWLAEATEQEAPARIIAAHRIKIALTNKEESLTLNHLSLTSLPNALNKLTTLKQLDVTDNCLTHLPELPAKLVKLKVSDNRLTGLPELPATLRSLEASRNDLATLPILPRNLVKCSLNHNLLTQIPNAFSLDMDGNSIVQSGLPCNVNDFKTDFSNNPFNKDASRAIANRLDTAQGVKVLPGATDRIVYTDGASGSALLSLRHAFSAWHPAGEGKPGLARSELGNLTKGANREWHPCVNGTTNFMETSLGKLAQSEDAPVFVDFLHNLNATLQHRDDAAAVLLQSQTRSILSAMLESPVLTGGASELKLRNAFSKWQPYKEPTPKSSQTALDKLASDHVAAPIFIDFMQAVEHMVTARPSVNDQSHLPNQVPSEPVTKQQIDTFLRAMLESPKLRTAAVE